MLMPWFIPVAVVLGVMGTKTGLEQRHLTRVRRDKSWWLIVVLAWLPMVYWVTAQFVQQY